MSESLLPPWKYMKTFATFTENLTTIYFTFAILGPPLLGSETRVSLLL